ncbi:MAG: hypothetical protein R3A79_31785 [Nannocystaceae bacterium]
MTAPLSRRAALLLPLLALPLVTASCNRGVVDNELAAELAYLGLDRAIDRMIDLGFDGFNAANSANIPTQSEAGDETGTMDVGGQVDQGASANKGMRLEVTLTDYSDGPVEDTAIYYNGGPGNADFSLKGLPNADLSGSFNGVYVMDGDLAGTVELNLQFTGKTADTGDGTIARVPGTITVVGTATSDYGVFDVNVSL